MAIIFITSMEKHSSMDDLGNSKSFDKKTGTYTYVDCSEKDWYKKISNYNDASPTQRIEIVQTDDYGYGLKVYIDGHYSKQASDNLMYAQSQDYLKEMGRTAVTMTGELSGAYDVYRLFTGKDPLTGDKTSRLEAGLWTAILLLPQAKMVMAAKELKAGNKALKGLNLTEKELKLLNQAGYFEDVGKLEKVSGAKFPKVEIPEQSLKHADVGDFTVNPSTGKVSKMKGGGHGQSNIDFLKENGFEVNIEKTYPNVVRIGNVPHHKTPSKRTGTGQSWFPENWTTKDIESAGQHIASQPNFTGVKDGEVIFGEYKGVRVGLIKTDGKIGTIFPDGMKQP
ncbi:EndoU domain-containing protein [Carnobacterium gallinarum]|uniref:EndoU domain-containing protein n=1 Tax=Carnobacterium gallinarum TaxID=2749 RepID=UPI0012F7460F|nr:EndoU domain-containing protein [Carnobacterium gallinarum]